MRAAFLAPMLIAFSSLSLGFPATASEDPRACHKKGDLAKGEDGVVAHKGRFTRKGGREYPFETFSLSAKDESRVPNMCFRYEVQNTGDKKIESFKWPDIDVWWVDISATKRIKETRDGQTEADKAKVEWTDVGAFKNEWDTTRAHFTLESVARKEVGSAKKEAAFTFFDYQDTMPQLIPVMEQAKLRVVPVVAFTRPALKTSFASLRTSFEAGNVTVSAVSSARYDGEKFEIDTVVTVDGEDVKLFMPTLSAIEKSFKPPFEENDVKSFVNVLPKFRSVSLSLEDNKFTAGTTFSVRKEADVPVLFVIAHPVTVRTPEQFFCIGVVSYSPVPVSVGGEFCNWEVLSK